jgi:uncharacterized protein YndB with AHSA1/START domain
VIEPDSTTAVVTRVMPAEPSVVYEAWIDAEALAEFICPSPTVSSTVECDPRVGGRLRIDMIDPDGVVHIVGEYLELDPPNRLRFTWNTSFAGGFDSVVTVTLQPHGEGHTLMTIEHAQLPPQWRGDHQQGWTRIAGQLDARLTARREDASSG